MVTKVADNGTLYGEPPYTDEEEMDLYRRAAGIKPDGSWAGGFTMVHRAPPAEPPAPPQKSPPPSPEE